MIKQILSKDVEDYIKNNPKSVLLLKDSYIFASETCALDIIGAKFIREVENGEIIVVENNKIDSIKPFPKQKARPCIFEYIYFARPDSLIDNKTAYEHRKNLGKELAKENDIKADIIVPVPDSGNAAALGFLSLKYKIQSLDWVHNVVTLLDIPLLNSSDAPLQERLESFKTLKDEGIDKNRGFNEIVNSPVFRNFVISEDGKTSGIIVYIKKNEQLKDVQKKTKEEIEKYKDQLKKQNHKNILEIRDVIKSYEDIGKIHLGGIPMIADDMMSFIKSDIVVFGIGVLIFIIATLWFVFKKIIWIDFHASPLSNHRHPAISVQHFSLDLHRAHLY